MTLIRFTLATGYDDTNRTDAWIAHHHIAGIMPGSDLDDGTPTTIVGGPSGTMPTRVIGKADDLARYIDRDTETPERPFTLLRFESDQGATFIDPHRITGVHDGATQTFIDVGGITHKVHGTADEATARIIEALTLNQPAP